MKKFIFDVDGTLTPSRKPMEKEFKEFFFSFASIQSVYLVTGSDKVKTLQQVGKEVYDLCKRVYQCSGNDVWEKDQNIRTSQIEIPEEMIQDFRYFLTKSEFNIRTGTHVDKRPGLINFSIIGRNCTHSERDLYVKHDEEYKEREEISEFLRRKYKDYDIQIAGQTGIDIIEKGKDKSQIISDFSTEDKLFFFGDKMDFGGNDYSLAQEVKIVGGESFHIKDWRETWEHLKTL